jgi:hypothetical protein
MMWTTIQIMQIVITNYYLVLTPYVPGASQWSNLTINHTYKMCESAIIFSAAMSDPLLCTRSTLVPVLRGATAPTTY